MQEGSMPERRQDRRFSLQFPCLINVRSKLPQMLCQQVETLNVSRSGAYLHAKQPLPEGTRIAIDMVVRFDAKLPFSTPGSCISLDGRVLRSDAQGMAVAFDGPYRICRIDELISRNRIRTQWLSGAPEGVPIDDDSEEESTRGSGNPLKRSGAMLLRRKRHPAPVA